MNRDIQQYTPGEKKEKEKERKKERERKRERERERERDPATSPYFGKLKCNNQEFPYL